MESIDINFYDNQIRTFGFEAFNKINTSSILIYGLDKGLATEISKNLVLTGIKNLYLYDNQPITEQDLETGYFYSRENIGLPRSIVLMKKLQEISPITIQSVDNYQQNINVMIVVNQRVETIQEISIYCRSKNIKLIVIWSKGVSGVIFVDAGDNHLITEQGNENFEFVQIGQINEFGKVECIPNSSHEFKTGDIINFTNLSGDNIVQLEK